MNIACATDNNYVQHCGVMLTSLFENNKGEDVHIYLLTAGLTQKNKTSLENIINHYKGNFHYCLLDQELIKDFPQGGVNAHITLAAYDRLFLPQYLPEKETKVIYLDCDLIVCSPLKGMWETDMSGYALGAVEEYWNWCNGSIKERTGRLKYDIRYSYFNSGVLLLNLTLWRKENITDKVLDYIINNPEKIIWHDQDALNATLHDRWIKLPARWNATPYSFSKAPELLTRYRQNRINTILNPGIIHFCFSPKPWETGCYHPLKDEYFRYLKLTEWKDFKPPFSIKTIRHWGGDVLRFIGIKKQTMLKRNDLQKLKTRSDRYT